jgi:hypothetical protein
VSAAQREGCGVRASLVLPLEPRASDHPGGRLCKRFSGPESVALLFPLAARFLARVCVLGRVCGMLRGDGPSSLSNASSARTRSGSVTSITGF